MDKGKTGYVIDLRDYLSHKNTYNMPFSIMRLIRRNLKNRGVYNASTP